MEPQDIVCSFAEPLGPREMVPSKTRWAARRRQLARRVHLGGRCPGILSNLIPLQMILQTRGWMLLLFASLLTVFIATFGSSVVSWWSCRANANKHKRSKSEDCVARLACRRGIRPLLDWNGHKRASRAAPASIFSERQDSLPP